ncbi:P1 family peptidase [Microbacterium sp. SORGH_AS_0862]|uniref:P1 family peptidase n=1 Tax=Microbacterium sp. SORGH_AS_0862 TaxID=3041789 RepID=UPI00278E9EF7|nr:P1 family peptidase [Microbacterium sp. SORGH_AS_0862]MDQ1205722.1 putative pantetheine hydrolase [Microbacterium sp. SORGH_AS_0862]
MSISASASHPVSGLDWRLGGTSGIRPGPQNSIVDVAGIRVGHAARAADGWLTGVSVVAAPGGARAAVDVRGGGAATRETAALDPTGVVERIHAVALTGGSAFGLEASAGVMAALRERGLGFRVGVDPRAVVPIVPAAAIFDLGRGGVFENHPDAALGRQAAEDALSDGTGAPVQGSVGAGIGAIAGEMRGGVGTASAVLPGGVVVAALVVVNADGTTVDPRSGILWGAFAELPLSDGGGEFGIRPPSAAEHAAARARLGWEAERRPALRPLNTTLAVVATDAGLHRAELARLASASHDGMARAIRPVHTLGDGDVVFALSAGDGALPDPAPGLHAEHAHSDAVNQVLTAGADVVTRAIVHAVLSVSTAHGAAGVVPSYRDLYGQR